MTGNAAPTAHEAAVQKIRTKKHEVRELNPCHCGGFMSIVLSTIHHIRISTFYNEAKKGNTDAAYYLICSALRHRSPLMIHELDGAVIVPVISVGSRNALPAALCEYLKKTNRVEINRSFLCWREERNQKEKGALARMLSRCGVSGGTVEPGRRYFIVDDFITTGRTVQNLRLHISGMGGVVQGGIFLGASSYSIPLLQTDDTKKQLCRFDAASLRSALEYLDINDGKPENLTNSEAKYLLKHKNLEDFIARSIIKRNEKKTGAEYDTGRRKREFKGKSRCKNMAD